MDSEGTSLRYCGMEELECGIKLKLKSTLTLQEQDNINARTWKDFFFASTLAVQECEILERCIRQIYKIVVILRIDRNPMRQSPHLLCYSVGVH